MSVYITSTGAFLPGPPIAVEEVEGVLGAIHGKPSWLRVQIQKANKIQTRHYAIDKNQQTTHSNTLMATNAASECLDRSYISRDKVGMLAVATTQGDHPAPGMASMVQAELGLPELEILTAHGICSSSMMALKAAWNSLRLEEHEAALVVSSELASRLLKKQRYEAATKSTFAEKSVDFNTEFLRWMLSDGAGALLLQNRPAPKGVSLRIDWVRGFSHAHAFPTCMSVGSAGRVDDERTWQDYDTYADAETAGALLMRQDVRLLDNILRMGVDGYLRLAEEGVSKPAEVDHFLCHYSSHHFKDKILELLDAAGVGIPEERWWTNLYTRGNTGAASLFIMIDEFLRTDEVEISEGQTILCFVPESGRFNTTYMQLTVVKQ
ncbi:MAG: StlD/DarB family beta-ketosynthase [Candidatus Poseidoniales archaeon]|nr:MAG: StlD/DarB family beta-ketosynthase [Candidatus Poseidoniales archaeon]|tara:strand:+ start:5154 stop:6290 length:1137 start_codon:yes stop_codon:yes gene_type:complete